MTKKLYSIIGERQLKLWGLILTTIILTYQFGEFVFGEKGFIATTSQIRTLEKNTFDLAIDIKEIQFAVIEKEIAYQKRKCGYNPLKGVCLNEQEKIYYSELLEERKLLIKTLESKEN